MPVTCSNSQRRMHHYSGVDHSIPNNALRKIRVPRQPNFQIPTPKLQRHFSHNTAACSTEDVKHSVRSVCSNNITAPSTYVEEFSCNSLLSDIFLNSCGNLSAAWVTFAIFVVSGVATYLVDFGALLNRLNNNSKKPLFKKTTRVDGLIPDAPISD